MPDSTLLALALPSIIVVALVLLFVIAVQVITGEPYPPVRAATPRPPASVMLPWVSRDDRNDALLIEHVLASLYAAAWAGG